MSIDLSKLIYMLPNPLPVVEFIFFIPLTAEKIPSNLEVTSCSATLGSEFGHEYWTVNDGRYPEGVNWIFNKGINEIPIIDRRKNIIIIEKFLLFHTNFLIFNF